ncbi:type VI secretion system tube protein TssD [Aquimarina sp. MMG016]|uniref:type VI secretion system tube protein TssD n=1 Tax=Aquimarina sp. MMG016 TaxID=2822690 RepID=UPI001B3A1F38|nr:type VI secretion system tube protein TssD [Aquimarina sp. MMG016]MBQ4819639.1 hypothetical protein [Aquimarina sp. MMG016]
MAFQAKLFINGEERNVLDSTFLYKQLIDINGRPKTNVQGGQIHFVIESTKNDELFYDWMFTDQQTYRGHIRFYHRDGFRKLFDYEFANCYCVLLEEKFSAQGNAPLKMHLTLSPGIQRVRDQIFEKAWNPNNPFVAAAPVTEREEKEPEIVSAAFIDSNGNEVKKVTEGNIILQVETKDMVGEMISIDLSDNNYDFLYNEELIENDILEDISVRSDQISIELKVIKQKIS